MRMQQEANEEALLNVLDPKGRDYSVLPITWVLALAGRSYYYFTRTTMARLAKAKKLKRLRQWYRHHLYAHPARRFEQVENEYEYSVDKHQFLGDIVRASIELGAVEAGFLYEDWRYIIPAELIQNNRYPRRFYLDQERYLVPDCMPCCISGETQARYIFGQEYDRDTEGGRLTNLARQSIKRKVTEYKELFDKRLWTIYGFENAVVLFITVNATRELEIRNIIAEVFKEKPCTYLWVTHTQDWFNARHFPEPPLDFFTRPYKRHLCEDAYLSEGLL